METQETFVVVCLIIFRQKGVRINLSFCGDSWYQLLLLYICDIKRHLIVIHIASWFEL